MGSTMKIRLHVEAEEGHGYSFELWSQAKINRSKLYTKKQKEFLIKSLSSPAHFNERFSPVVEEINYYDDESERDICLDVVKDGDGAPNNELLTCEVQQSSHVRGALELTFSGSIDIEGSREISGVLQKDIDSIDYYPYFQSSDGTLTISNGEGYELVHNYNLPFTAESPKEKRKG